MLMGRGRSLAPSREYTEINCPGFASFAISSASIHMLYISAARASWETTAAVIFLCAICSSYSTRLISATMSFTACLDASPKRSGPNSLYFSCL